LKITLVIVLAATLVGGLVGAVAGLGLAGNSGSPRSASRAAAPSELAPGGSPSASDSPEQLYRRDARGVVAITSARTRKAQPTFFRPARKERVADLGSGFVVDKRGDILTNDHVVRGGTGIRVGFSSGASYPARVVGADRSSDVAVVQVKAPPSALDPLRFANSSPVEVGDPVYALGDPFGLDRTMTAGIVSTTGRDIEARDGVTIPNAIQTDAPINRGNSGGPLLDRFGGVIGINAQIESGTADGNVGIGFAIPSDTARTVAAALIQTGHAEHAWLGVDAETIDSSVAGVVHSLPSHGAAIRRVVKRGPAAEAGLKGATRAITVDGLSAPLGGDTIVAVDRKSISTSEQLADAVAAHRPGDGVALTVVREGKRRTVTATLGTAPGPKS
jgi:S1-C subfamily serine protease